MWADPWETMSAGLGGLRLSMPQTTKDPGRTIDIPPSSRQASIGAKRYNMFLPLGNNLCHSVDGGFAHDAPRCLCLSIKLNFQGDGGACFCSVSLLSSANAPTPG